MQVVSDMMVQACSWLTENSVWMPEKYLVKKPTGKMVQSAYSFLRRWVSLKLVCVGSHTLKGTIESALDLSLGVFSQ